MEVMEFKNGCTVTVPDGVTAIFHSVENNSRRAEGIICGNEEKAGGLIVGVIDRYYNNLDDTRKALFAMAVVNIFQKSPAKNMEIQTISVYKRAEDDDE